MDGELLVNNEGMHGMVEKCHTSVLSAGAHILYIEGFQAGGDVGMIAQYEGPDTDNNRVPIMSGRISSRYDSHCNPTAVSLEPVKFSICMFKSVSTLSKIPRIGDEVFSKHLSFLGQSQMAVVDMHQLETFRAYVPDVPNQNYVWAISGQLIISMPGTYSLCISSDDGYLLWWSILYILNC